MMTRRSEGEASVVSYGQLQAAWRSIRGGWSQSPGAGRRLLGTYAVGTLVLAALSAGSALWMAGRAVDGRVPLDGTLEPALREVFTIHQAVWVAALGSSAVLVPLVVLVAILAAREGRWIRAVSYPVLYVACKVVKTAGWTSWGRERPGDVAEGVLVPMGLSSYPSGHTLQSVALWGILVWWWVRASDSLLEKTVAWSLFVGLNAAIAVSRIETSAHHPTDVIAAFALGLGCLGVAIAAEVRAEKGADR